MKLLKKLNQYKEDGWLISQSHPTLPLTIWNYSKKTQFEGKWDEITIMCRGLVTWDETGEIIARPFKKFWNMEENKHTATKDFEIFEKMDGSLIVTFFIWGMWIGASRGSFTSDQAIAAQNLMNNMNISSLNRDATYLFEYTSPTNRIVVDYGSEEKLTLLAAIRTEDGVEAPYDTLRYNAKLLPCSVVKRYDGVTDFNEFKKAIGDNEEGGVVRFSNGDRMKVKGEEYFRLHRIMTEISTKRVWEYLKDGTDIEVMLDNVPDEFYDKIKAYVKELKYAYFQISETAGKKLDYFVYGKYGDVDPTPTKKEVALYIKKQEPYLQSIMFAMYNKHDYSQGIWKLLQPKFEKL